MPKWALEMFESIPATFWGVIVGSFFSLSGVVISNRATETRQRAQFENDQRVRKEERELALRKEVYMAAAEAIHTGMLMLTKLSNFEIPVDEHIRPYLDKAPALAKVQIVASEDTIRAVFDVAGEISSSILRLTGMRIPLDMARKGRLSSEALAAQFEKERDRWLEEMKQFNLASSTDVRLWATIQGNYGFEEKRARELRVQIAQAHLELFSRQLQFADDCIAESQALFSAIIPAITAIRLEFGLPFDVVKYEGAMREMLASQQLAVAEFLKTARQAVVPAEVPQGDNSLNTNAP